MLPFSILYSGTQKQRNMSLYLILHWKSRYDKDSANELTRTNDWLQVTQKSNFSDFTFEIAWWSTSKSSTTNFYSMLNIILCLHFFIDRKDTKKAQSMFSSQKPFHLLIHFRAISCNMCCLELPFVVWWFSNFCALNLGRSKNGISNGKNFSATTTKLVTFLLRCHFQLKNKTFHFTFHFSTSISRITCYVSYT